MEHAYYALVVHGTQQCCVKFAVHSFIRTRVFGVANIDGGLTRTLGW